MKMLGNRQAAPPIALENPLWISWHDTQMMGMLNTSNVMDYFCRKANPFYDRACNNETIRMQRLGPEHLNNMIGVEFVLLHVSEPSLYVIRKQNRHSPTEATALGDYYILKGMIYKAPDLASVINSRVLATVTNLQAAFEETTQYMRYNPNKGYTWDFASNKALAEKARLNNKKEQAPVEEPVTPFQMQRIDMLLTELLRNFPPPAQKKSEFTQSNSRTTLAITNGTSDAAQTSNATNHINNGISSPATPKQEPMDMKPPPEKKNKN